MRQSLLRLRGFGRLEEGLQLHCKAPKSTEPLCAVNFFQSFGRQFIVRRLLDIRYGNALLRLDKFGFVIVVHRRSFPHSRRYVAGLSAIARLEIDRTTCWSESWIGGLNATRQTACVPGESCLKETTDWVISTGSVFTSGLFRSFGLLLAVMRLTWGPSRSTVSEEVFSTSKDTSATAPKRFVL